MKPPRTSVITPSLNMAATLGDAIRSVQNQTDQDYEHLVLDDGSSDDTQALFAQYTYDPKIRFFRNGVCRGKSEARNLLIREARGTYLSILDADDYLLPNKLERHASLLDNDMSTALVWGHALDICTVTGRLELVPDTAVTPAWDILQTYNAYHSAMTWRADVMAELGGYRKAFDGVEDVDLFFRTGDRHKRLHDPTLTFLRFRRNAKTDWLTPRQRALSSLALYDTLERRGMLYPGELTDKLLRDIANSEITE